MFGTDQSDGSFSLYATTDTIEGSEIRRAIQAETDRLYRDDGGREGAAEAGRTHEQRRLDAMVALLKRGAGLESGNKARRPHARYRGVVRIPLERYLRDAEIDATFIGEGPLPRSVVDRILCDAELAPLVVDVDGNPLWMGRRTRTATDEQWTALVDRDGGCVVCGADPSYCEAHHLDFWERGGDTNIDNLALLCTRHHHDLHDNDLELAKTGRAWELRPRHRSRSVRAA